MPPFSVDIYPVNFKKSCSFRRKLFICTIITN